MPLAIPARPVAPVALLVAFLAFLALASPARAADAVADSALDAESAVDLDLVAEEALDPALALKLEGMEEQFQALQGEVDRLRKVKFSGYLQARYEVSEADNDSVRVAGSPAVLTPANLERFFLRRARFKLTYDHAPWSQLVLTVDAGADRQVRMLDGYMALTEPRTPEPRHQLWIGQFNVPFGYEIERSSSFRELPERSRMENVLFPGERDRGIKVSNLWTPRLETVVAVLNGGGIGSAEYPTTDPSRAKEWLGRVRALYGFLDVGVSGSAGKGTLALTGPDAVLPRTRVGADAQLYFELPRLGGGTVRGEYWGGHQQNPDSVSALTTRPSSANPVVLPVAGANLNHIATDFAGFYVMAVQNLGGAFQLAARYDRYDPNVDVARDQYARWSVAAHAFYQGLTRFTLAYEIPRTERPDGVGGWTDPKDNLWTLQFQHTF